MKYIYSTLAGLMVAFALTAQNKSIRTGIDKDIQVPGTEKMSPNFQLPEHMVKRTPVVKTIDGQIQNLKSFQKKSTVLTTAADTVMFMRPAGYFLAGVSRNYYYYDYYFLLGPAYTDVTWRNLSTDGITSYNWTLPDPEATTVDEYGYIISTVSKSEKNPVLNYPFDIYMSTPQLNASDGSGNSYSFHYGGMDSVILFNGAYYNDYWLPTGYGACNYDHHLGMSIFDSSDANDIYAISNYFEKPSQKYLLDTLWIGAYTCNAPAGTEFELTIYKIDDEGYFSDTLGTSTITIEDVEGPLYDGHYCNLLFSEYDVYNEDLGFNISKDYLEIEDAIFVELKGFDATGVELQLLLQYDESPVQENNAYVLFNDEESSIGWFGYNTSFFFNLNASFSYMFADDYEFQAPKNSSSKTFTIKSGYPVTEIELDGTLPEWISVNKAYNSDKDELYLTLSVTNLPDGTTNRTEDLVFYVNETYVSITVNQDDANTGIKSNSSENIKVIKNGDMLSLSYPSNYKNLTLYNVSGKFYGSYDLPSNGSYSFIPKVQNNEIYLLIFSGNEINTPVKIMY